MKYDIIDKIVTIYSFINNETGEVTTNPVDVIKSLEEQRKSKKTKSNKTTSEELKTLIFHNLGNFYHLYYDNLPNISRAMKFRFMYLCTFVKLDGYLMQDDTELKLTKSDIKTKLKLAKAPFYDTYNTFVKQKLISETKNGIKVSKAMCVNGTIHKYSDSFTRTFNETIRELYEEHTSYEHERLGILLDLMKYIHIQSNELCFNPTECDVDKIIPMSRKQILKELGISEKTFAEFMKLKICNNKQYVVLSIGTNRSFKYVLNPKISYKGNAIPALQKLIDSHWFVVRTPILTK